MLKREFISNITTIISVGVAYTVSLTEILTVLVLLTAFILNIINIVYKLKNKGKHNETSS